MHRSGIALLALIALSAPVAAADLGGWQAPANTSPVFSGVSATQWSGFYAGINGGFGWGTTSLSPVIGGAAPENNSSGWSLGGQAGYNVDMGGFVIGAEADLQWTNLGYAIPGTNVEAKLDMFGTLRGRAGIPIGQVMPYATLGGAFGRGSVTESSPGVTSSAVANHFGWTAGVGLEAQATANLSLKAEYLYVDLGSQAYDALPVAGAFDTGHRFSVVRAGVNYKF